MLRKATPERLSTFSDGVFLITVLVLDLRPPEQPTFEALLSLWPTWLSYAVSYLFIAIVWTNHHYLLRYCAEATHHLLWFNFAHLFSMSLLPLSTAWMAVSELAPQPVALGGLLPRERDLRVVDLGACRPKPRQGNLAERAQDYAGLVGRDLVPVRSRSGRGAEISAARTRYLYRLPDRLSATRAAGREEASITPGAGVMGPSAATMRAQWLPCRQSLRCAASTSDMPATSARSTAIAANAALEIATRIVSSSAGHRPTTSQVTR